MKNKTSLFVLVVEILAIVLLHTMKANADNPTNNSAKEIPKAKAELASSELEHTIFFSSLR